MQRASGICRGKIPPPGPRKWTCGHSRRIFEECLANTPGCAQRTGADAAGRSIGVSTVCHVVCRESQAEAEDYYQRFAVDCADTGAVDEHVSKKKAFSGSHDDATYLRYRQRFAGGAGSYPLVGTPAFIAEQLNAIVEVGYGGVALSFVNYREELPFFCAQVLPLLGRMGLRD